MTDRLKPMDGDGGNVLNLSPHLPKRRAGARCFHDRFDVDEAHDRVYCRDCGTGLNPMWVLKMLAAEESTWQRRAKIALAVEAELKTRQRTKCVHCGEMTPIRFKASP